MCNYWIFEEKASLRVSKHVKFFKTVFDIDLAYLKLPKLIFLTQVEFTYPLAGVKIALRSEFFNFQAAGRKGQSY